MTSTVDREMAILLIEDNPADVRLTQEALRDSNDTTLFVVSNGMDAIAFLNREDSFSTMPRPDLIILDLNLPRKDGREVLEDIKTQPQLRRIPVVILTSSQADSDVIATYDLHANSYISKPVDHTQYIRIVRGIHDYWFKLVQLPAD